MKKKLKNLPQLDYACLVGERVFWTNIIGDRLEGVIQEWNNNVAIIKTDNDLIIEIVC